MTTLTRFSTTRPDNCHTRSVSFIA